MEKVPIAYGGRNIGEQAALKTAMRLTGTFDFETVGKYLRAKSGDHPYTEARAKELIETVEGSFTTEQMELGELDNFLKHYGT